MEYLYTLSSWLLNAWLYIMSFGVYYMLISLCSMLILLFFVLRMRIVPTVFLSVFSSIFAPILLGVIVINLGACIQIPHVKTPQELPHPIVMGLVVSAIYTALQALFFGITSVWYRCSVLALTCAAAVSNSIAGIVISFFYKL